MSHFVLDNSVTMRWFFESGDHPYADRVLLELSSINAKAIVPLLSRYEVGAVLARARIKADISAQDVADFIEDLQLLPHHLDSDGNDHVFSTAYSLAIANRLTVYDAVYLELALRLKLPLATLDVDLIKACRRAGMTVF